MSIPEVAARRGERGKLSVHGARVHNLQNVDLEIPRDSLVVFTGLSGSGKSSLAFDTIFAEGQRRYVESLSAYARQFLGQVDRPDVDFIDGLSPAVSIDQKSTNRNPRSTVGTITEIYDYLRLLWARIGMPHCPVCGERISRQTVQQIADQLMTLEEGTRYQVLAPVISQKKGEFVDLFRELELERLLTRGRRRRGHPAQQPAEAQEAFKHDISVVVDRLVAGPDILTRLTDSLETALRLTDGLVTIDYVDVEGEGKYRNFSEKLSCPNDHPHPAHRDRAAHLLVQRAVRRLPGVLGARHPDVGGPRPADRRRHGEHLRGRDPAVDERRARASTTTSRSCSTASPTISGSSSPTRGAR